MNKRFTIMVVLLVVMAGRVLADASTYLNFTAVNDPATISLTEVNWGPTIGMQYSTDNCNTWNSFNYQTIQLAVGEKVFFKADSTNLRMSYCNPSAQVIRGYYR